MTPLILFFVVSGFCGLAYEVVWLRLAMASFGINAPVLSTVIAVYMAGLGLGSWAGGRLAGSRASCLRRYASAELFVGMWALAVPAVLAFGHRRLSGLDWASSGYYSSSALWIELALLPPTLAMGAGFPLAMGAARGSRKSFGSLYAANVLGAALGVSCCAAFLIELLGFAGTIRLAAFGNASIAAAAWASSLGMPAGAAPRAARAAARADADVGLTTWLFLTGFVSMAMEVAWVRLFTPYFGTTIYVFASLLAVYLLATFIGAAAYKRFDWKASRPGRAWLALGAAGLLPSFVANPFLVPRFVGAHPLLLIPLVLGPFCGILGWLTPQWVDRRSAGDPALGGTAYAANVLGSILGPLAAGFLLIPRLGEWATVIALSGAALAMGLWLARGESRLRLAAALAFVLSIAARPDPAKWGVKGIRRDYEATVTASPGLLRVNGIAMSSLTHATKLMAHLPLSMLGRRPEKVLDIAFGMGTTFRSCLSWGVQTTVVDLVPSVPLMFGYFHADADQVRASPLAKVVIDDGRRYLERAEDGFDVITIDPPPPIEAAGSGLLYSREFYALAKARILPGGVLQQWVPFGPEKAIVTSIARALRAEFPYVRIFRCPTGEGLHFIASMSPLEFESPERLAARLPPAAAADLAEGSPSHTALEWIRLTLDGEIPYERLLQIGGEAPALDDDRPFNEYYLVRRTFPSFWRGWSGLAGI